ncbi:hypothetical protein ALC60_01956 [Trachymyrmex zeteki]|uniref:Uncharacterized protein n=1 Tax=Mycetomoellerius zeteki TaxID=64791 RepID=A0A151XFF9_9HYME|nr:hypothetical protein ALC60_01956 [Trachymyrmex zeteki]
MRYIIIGSHARFYPQPAQLKQSNLPLRRHSTQYVAATPLAITSLTSNISDRRPIGLIGGGVLYTFTYNPRPPPSLSPGWRNYLLKATVGPFVTGLRLNLDQKHPNFTAGLRNPPRLLTIKLGAPRPTFTLVKGASARFRTSFPKVVPRQLLALALRLHSLS